MTNATELADKWRRQAYEMSLAGGESPRPKDYSEGHYVGVMKTLRECAEQLHALDQAAEGASS